MPVVEPWYNPNFDVGQPAFTSFWNAYIGTRSEINDKIMRERLAGQDPGELLRLERALRQNIVDLEDQKRKIGHMASQTRQMTDRDQSKVFVAFLNNATKLEAEKIQGSYGLARAKVSAATDFELGLRKMSSERYSAYNRGLGSDVAGGSITDVNNRLGKPGSGEKLQSETYAKALSTIDRNTKDEAERKGAARALLGNAEDPSNQHSAGAETVRQYLGMPRGVDPDQWIIEDQGIMSPEDVSIKRDELLSMYKAGGMSFTDLASNTMDLYGFSPETKDQMMMKIETGGTMQFAGPGDGTSGGGVPGGPTQGGDAIRQQMAAKDKEIEGMRDRLKDIEARTAAKSPRSAFADFMGNAMTETLFVSTPTEMRPVTEAVRQLRPEQAAGLNELLKEADGDPRQALALLRERQAQRAEMPDEPPIEALPEPDIAEAEEGRPLEEQVLDRAAEKVVQRTEQRTAAPKIERAPETDAPVTAPPAGGPATYDDMQREASGIGSGSLLLKKKKEAEAILADPATPPEMKAKAQEAIAAVEADLLLMGATTSIQE